MSQQNEDSDGRVYFQPTLLRKEKVTSHGEMEIECADTSKYIIGEN